METDSKKIFVAGGRGLVGSAIIGGNSGGIGIGAIALTKIDTPLLS